MQFSMDLGITKISQLNDVWWLYFYRSASCSIETELLSPFLMMQGRTSSISSQSRFWKASVLRLASLAHIYVFLYRYQRHLYLLNVYHCGLFALALMLGSSAAELEEACPAKTTEGEMLSQSQKACLNKFIIQTGFSIDNATLGLRKFETLNSVKHPNGGSSPTDL